MPRAGTVTRHRGAHHASCPTASARGSRPVATLASRMDLAVDLRSLSRASYIAKNASTAQETSSSLAPGVSAKTSTGVWCVAIRQARRPSSRS
ncbi:hypothetical protein [Ornithinimicrobium kibberense]|uniref:hypothetical protein n=1 Tax=Ornithinimicrobium kibberense TaxID=282060 RepID=UPI00360B2EAC